MSHKPRWSVEGRDWPNAEASRFVTAGGLRWHVQDTGSGPVILLLHGAGAATHSWRGLLPALATRWRVIAPDLPGHGFTDTPAGGLSLSAMARDIAALMRALDIRPALVVGHSAGAAIALRLALDGATGTAPVVALNGALKPFAGAAAPLFRGLALGLFVNPVAVSLFASAAQDRRRVERLIEGTGSTLDAEGIEIYARLFRSRGHVAATLGMMGSWDVGPTLRDLPRLKAPLTLVVGAGDLAVPPSVAREAVASHPGAGIVTLDRLGHLAHEEDPDRVAAVIEAVAAEHRVKEEAT